MSIIIIVVVVVVAAVVVASSVVDEDSICRLLCSLVNDVRPPLESLRCPRFPIIVAVRNIEIFASTWTPLQPLTTPAWPTSNAYPRRP
jgi:hypothetical protein